MSGAYWGLTTLDLLEKLNTVDVDEVCRDSSVSSLNQLRCLVTFCYNTSMS